MKKSMWVLIIAVAIAQPVAAYEFRKDDVEAKFISGAELWAPNFKTMSREKILLADGSSQKSREPIFPFQFHWIKKGAGTILAIRKYTEGKPRTIDDEEYLKTTIWIKNLKVGKVEFANSNDALVFFTQGGSAWPRVSCGGASAAGHVEIKKVTETEVLAAIDSEIKCTYPIPNKVTVVKLKETHTFKKLSVESITPWIGKPGNDLASETHRDPLPGRDSIEK